MSEGGFDVAAYRRGISDPDRGLLVTFRYEAVKQNDGGFKNVEYINIWLSNSDQVDRPVTEADRIRFKTRYEAFRAGEKEPDEGTPIKMCAFATPANVAACKSERIFTIEQLVETPDERLMRPKLIQFKYMCRDYLESQKRHGYVGELRAEIDKLKAQIKALEGKRAEKEEEPPKKRGRPPKVKEADAIDTAGISE